MTWFRAESSRCTNVGAAQKHRDGEGAPPQHQTRREWTKVNRSFSLRNGDSNSRYDATAIAIVKPNANVSLPIRIARLSGFRNSFWDASQWNARTAMIWQST